MSNLIVMMILICTMELHTKYFILNYINRMDINIIMIAFQKTNVLSLRMINTNTIDILINIKIKITIKKSDLI